MGSWPAAWSISVPRVARTRRITRSVSVAARPTFGWRSTCCRKRSPQNCCTWPTRTSVTPVTESLSGLPAGFSPLVSQPGRMALDFIRANLFDRQQMQPVPASVPGPDNDLADKLDHFVRRAAADSAARLYGFGQRWGLEAGIPDKILA